MPFVRNVLADLVEKRLWPVALLLFGALVAVPLVLSKKESPAPKPTASSKAVAAPLNGQALISLDTGRTGRLVGGGANDPFKQRFVPGTTVARAEARSGTTVDDNVEVNVDEGGGGDSGGSSSGGTPSRPRRTRTTAERANLVFGRTDQTRRSFRVEALTAMPSTTNPLLVYLGRVGSHAVFLVSSDASPTGEGTCVPSRSVCSEVRLRLGQTEYFDVSTSRGEVQYQLDFRGFVRG
jgi:hypothetical protein